jgi:hypothetical protein
VTDVFRGIGDLLPNPIHSRGQLRPVALGLSSQFLNRSRHGVTLLDFFQDELALISIVPRRDDGKQFQFVCLVKRPQRGGVRGPTSRTAGLTALVSRPIPSQTVGLNGSGESRRPASPAGAFEEEVRPRPLRSSSEGSSGLYDRAVGQQNFLLVMGRHMPDEGPIYDRNQPKAVRDRRRRKAQKSRAAGFRQLRAKLHTQGMSALRMPDVPKASHEARRIKST